MCSCHHLWNLYSLDLSKTSLIGKYTNTTLHNYINTCKITNYMESTLYSIMKAYYGVVIKQEIKKLDDFSTSLISLFFAASTPSSRQRGGSSSASIPRLWEDLELG